MNGRPHRGLGLALLLSFALALPATQVDARDWRAATAEQARAAIDAAVAGDVVTLAPGNYELGGIVIRQSGRPSQPITVRARRPGTVEIRTAAIELFKIAGSDWVFENLDIAGVCPVDAQCEHAFHIVGGADRTVIRNNRVRDFNAQIKGNGEDGKFPQDVVIEGNTLFGTHRRAVELPLAAVDVVGGRHWVVRDNLIADFGKSVDHPPRIPDDFGYAVFLKGNSSHGVIGRNLVVCGLALPPALYTRGISLGGSATDPGLCEETCATEHRHGVVRANLVVDCPTGFGIYLYKASDSRVRGNALIDTGGIFARSPETSAQVANNIVSGDIAATEGARIVANHNLLTDLRGMPAAIVDPGDSRPDAPPEPSPRLALAVIGDDLCLYLRRLGPPAGSFPNRASNCAWAGAAIAGYRDYVARLRHAATASGRKPDPQNAPRGEEE